MPVPTQETPKPPVKTAPQADDLHREAYKALQQLLQLPPLQEKICDLSADTPSLCAAAHKIPKNLRIRTQTETGIFAKLAGKARLQKLKIRLLYEKFRLGGDVSSLYLLRKHGRSAQSASRFPADFLPITINQWLAILASAAK